MESIFVLSYAALVLFCLMLAYKKRIAIGKWLDDPDSLTANGNRKKLLKRRIEDAQEQIEEIERKEAETKRL